MMMNKQFLPIIRQINGLLASPSLTYFPLEAAEADQRQWQRQRGRQINKAKKESFSALIDGRRKN